MNQKTDGPANLVHNAKVMRSKPKDSRGQEVSGALSGGQATISLLSISSWWNTPNHFWLVAARLELDLAQINS